MGILYVQLSLIITEKKLKNAVRCLVYENQHKQEILILYLSPHCYH